MEGSEWEPQAGHTVRGRFRILYIAYIFKDSLVYKYLSKILKMPKKKKSVGKSIHKSGHKHCFYFYTLCLNGAP